MRSACTAGSAVRPSCATFGGANAIGHLAAFLLQYIGDHYLGAFAREHTPRDCPHAGYRADYGPVAAQRWGRDQIARKGVGWRTSVFGELRSTPIPTQRCSAPSRPLCRRTALSTACAASPAPLFFVLFSQGSTGINFSFDGARAQPCCEKHNTIKCGEIVDVINASLRAERSNLAPPHPARSILPRRFAPRSDERQFPAEIE